MVANMKTVLVDKIASITQALNLGHELRVATKDLPCDEGVVLVVEILNNKSTYNTLELTSGRMAKLAKGDVIVGALGHRQALFGYSGHLPESVQVGDVIQVLNIGGVLGIVDSVNPEKGRPFDAKRHRRRAAVPVSGRAHRRAGARRLPAPRLQRDGEYARRSCRRARRHVHGSRQNRSRLRDRRADAPSRIERACVQSDGRVACVVTFSRWKTRAPAAA